MHYRINEQRVVVSGSAVVEKGETLEVTADDGTVLRLDWNRPDNSSSSGGTEDLKLLLGSFPDEPEFPHISQWGVGDPAKGRAVSIRVYAERIHVNGRVVNFTVLANF